MPEFVDCSTCFGQCVLALLGRQLLPVFQGGKWLQGLDSIKKPSDSGDLACSVACAYTMAYVRLTPRQGCFHCFSLLLEASLLDILMKTTSGVCAGTFQRGGGNFGGNLLHRTVSSKECTEDTACLGNFLVLVCYPTSVTSWFPCTVDCVGYAQRQGQQHLTSRGRSTQEGWKGCRANAIEC